jgi:hypothetical protein
MKKFKTLLLRNVFDNTAGWKTDENGNIVIKDGNPVWLDASGREGTVGVDTIGRLNAENKAFRTRAETAEGVIKAFEGLDAAAARTALETVSALGEGGVVDASKLEQVKAQITAQYEAQIADLNGQLGNVTGQLNNTVLSAAFSSSDFITKNIAVPVDLLQASFAKNFKVENGNIIPLDTKGEPIYSKKRFGEIADFDEGISILVDGYANKDRILKAPSGGGSGSGGQGGGRGNGSVVRRADFEGMGAAEQASIASKMSKGEVQIVD